MTNDQGEQRPGAISYLVNGMPKAGSHLLQKAVKLFPGVTNSKVSFVPSFFSREVLAEGALRPAVPLGMGRFVPIPVSAVRDAVMQVKPGQFAMGHVPFTQEFEAIMHDANWRVVTILRDPRDVVVSHASFVGEKTDNYFHTLSPEDRITTSITGVEAMNPKPIRLLSINDRYRRIVPWTKSSLNYTTRFEWLIGSKGGGSDEQQRIELLNIASHLGLPSDDECIEKVSANMFGGTTTFRGGATGRWHKAFSESHKALFKKIAGDLLIELGYEQDMNW